MKSGLFLFILLLLVGSVQAATLQGQIYDLNLTLVDKVILKINTEPEQQYLSLNGKYAFEVPAGKYTLIAQSGNLSTIEEIKVSGTGTYVFDLFLFPSLEEEEQLWQDIADIDFETNNSWLKYPLWSYLIAVGIFLIAFGRIILARKKYRSAKPKPSIEETAEPKYLEETLEIIKKHEGSLTQKELRKELMHLSEAKVSLILTELEHKQKIEKIKKGRGNVIILK